MVEDADTTGATRVIKSIVGIAPTGRAVVVARSMVAGFSENSDDQGFYIISQNKVKVVKTKIILHIF